jgi:hypothetical protein
MNKNENIKEQDKLPVADEQNLSEQTDSNNDVKINEEEKPDKNLRDRVQLMLAQELFDIEKLLREGYITKDQVAELTNNSIDKARKLLTKQESPIKNALDKTDFFNKKGRENILVYLKSLDTDFDEDEVNLIAQLVKTAEENAIESYLDTLRHGENFEKENAEAKQKLNTIAQNASTSSPYQRLFTRADIGKMSTSEFLKNEKLIMEQLRKGQIR